MKNEVLYAHSRRDAERSQWQALDAHADGVARLAASFARPFGSSEWAALLGEILHALFWTLD